ncbi:MAG TPA: hypothetical protein VKK79_20970 [Candidatus Lokiarchaeia archaeon]|nr:hypothetical protein [Candidatus Lokiarchaeia archaeon]
MWQKRYQYVVLVGWILVVVFAWVFFLGISILFMNKLAEALSIIAILVGAPLFAAFYDVIHYEAIGTWKMALEVLLGTACLVVLAFDPNAIVIKYDMTGGMELGWAGPLQVIGSIGTFFNIFLFYLPSIQIHMKAPATLKKYTRLSFVSIIVIMIGVILVQGGLIPGTEGLFTIFVIIIFVYILRKAPQLGFVLPFTASRLTILSTESGIPLFDHAWAARDAVVDDTLYGGMLQGLCSFFQESLRKGRVREVRLEYGVLILNYDETRQVAFVLLATAVTKSLRQALDHFAQQFFVSFKAVTFSGGNVSQFESANELVQKYFAFVPE